MSRSLTMPVLLASAVAVPYVATHAPEWKEQWAANASRSAPAAVAQPQATAPKWPPVAATRPAAPQWPTAGQPSNLAAPPAPVAPSATLATGQTPLEGTPTYSLAEVLRMDVTKEWVYQRWARKSTALSELDLYGVRVPLVTGTKNQDLAGSLTYFFTQDGRVQRISFRGRTGDTTELVGLTTQRYGLAWQTPSAAGEQLLELRQGDDVISRLRTRPAPVLWANTPNDSFTVELELQDPSRARPLAPQLAPLPPVVAEAKPADAKKKGDEKKADEKEPITGWKAFFPRSRVPKEQIPGLNANNMYR